MGLLAPLFSSSSGVGKEGSRRAHQLQHPFIAGHEGASRLGAQEGPRVTILDSSYAILRLLKYSSLHFLQSKNPVGFGPEVICYHSHLRICSHELPLPARLMHID